MDSCAGSLNIRFYLSALCSQLSLKYNWATTHGMHTADGEDGCWLITTLGMLRWGPTADHECPSHQSYKGSHAGQPGSTFFCFGLNSSTNEIEVPCLSARPCMLRTFDKIFEHYGRPCHVPVCVHGNRSCTVHISLIYVDRTHFKLTVCQRVAITTPSLRA
jgi:hypothetical protein